MGDDKDPSRGVSQAGEAGNFEAAGAPVDLFKVPLSPHPDEIEAEPQRFGRGRPKGSRNRTSEDLARLVQQIGGHPVLAMARVAGMSLDQIKQMLGCTRLDAFDRWIHVLTKLAPYVASQMPVAVQVSGKVATLNIGMQVGARELASGPDAVAALFDQAAKTAQAEGFRLPAPPNVPDEENSEETSG